LAGAGDGAGAAMAPVTAGSSPESRSNLDGVPLAGREAKLHATAVSHSASASSSSSGSGVIGAATSGDDLLTIQALSRGSGNGLDEASGTATKNTRAPHSSPATTIAEWEIRSAELTATNDRITYAHTLCRMERDRPRSPAGHARSSRPASERIVVHQNYFRVNRVRA
jgi:hypothetical protein